MTRDRSLHFQVVSGKKLTVRLPNIKIVARLQFLTRVTNCTIWTRQKREQVRLQSLYLMEGFMDVIAAYRAGIENAVASMGTALSKEHVDHLKTLYQKKLFSAMMATRQGRQQQPRL